MSGAVITLSKPIKAHAEEVDSITLREPTTEDEIELGQPFLLIVGDGETAIKVQPKVLAQYIVRLAGIPMSSVKQMARADFSKAQAAVMGFFGADESGQLSS